ncbi:hypothetical protein MLD38_031856 [Melastoma candidum]|uniref:Uncharacterized protein n=1 Tax=Melastoma candidum TaxID=119954 RepID=A0ACB9MSE0_9MYRT|nr:hypothetical protein MLD38_031856 [Melastoma candidum]
MAAFSSYENAAASMDSTSAGDYQTCSMAMGENGSFTGFDEAAGSISTFDDLQADNSHRWASKKAARTSSLLPLGISSITSTILEQMILKGSSFLFSFRKKAYEMLVSLAATAVAIPTIDLDDGRASLLSSIASASEGWGAFHVINHGVPLELLDLARQLGASFLVNSGGGEAQPEQTLGLQSHSDGGAITWSYCPSYWLIKLRSSSMGCTRARSTGR